MQYIEQLLFVIVLGVAIYFFIKKVKQIRRNIFLGKDEIINDQKAERWKVMAKVALGQSKMVVRPVAGFFHILIYIGFVLINIEVLEILIDGVAGTHRSLSFLGSIYNTAIGFFEILAVLVLIACVVFLARRFIVKIPRFHSPEMKGWATKDATYILVIEIVLMVALLKMNAVDQLLQVRGADHYIAAGSFPVSQYLTGFFSNYDTSTLIVLERVFWWFHILGILFFLNYVPYSKHLHIFLAFPNTWYSRLSPSGEFQNMPEITNEVNMMLDPSKADPNMPPPEKFGVNDVTDLSWKNLLDAYSCTECGRCTSSCPANITGKKLSPRKIMMDTRDRAGVYITIIICSFHFESHETIFHISHKLAIFIVCNFSIVHPQSSYRNLFVWSYVSVKYILITLACMKCSCRNIDSAKWLWVKPRSSSLNTNQFSIVTHSTTD